MISSNIENGLKSLLLWALMLSPVTTGCGIGPGQQQPSPQANGGCQATGGMNAGGCGGGLPGGGCGGGAPGGCGGAPMGGGCGAPPPGAGGCGGAPQPGAGGGCGGAPAGGNQAPQAITTTGGGNRQTIVISGDNLRTDVVRPQQAGGGGL